MRPTPTLLVATLLAVAGCGGDDSADAESDDTSVTADAGDATNGAGGGADDGDGDGQGDGDGSGESGDSGSGQDPDFDVTTLPEDFPAELVPPVWETGQYTQTTDFPTATFESSMPFDEIVTYYNSVHGEGEIVGDAPGERLAEWTASPPWMVSVFEADPVRIGISQIPDG